MQVRRSDRSQRFIATLKSRLGDVATRLRRFAGDRRGNVAMIFGITFIPIVLAGGTGVDLARAFIVQQRLSHALDAAALAVGTALQKSDAELEALAQSFFDANYPEQELGVPGTLNMTINDNVVTLEAAADVETAFMRIVGQNEMSVHATTEVTRKLTGLEVVLVLDNTGSMRSNGKLTALKTAASKLIQILFGDDANPDYLKMALVPFAAAVNVGPQYLNSGWIDTTGASSVNGLNFSGGKHAAEIYDMITNKSWNGCVEARPNPLDVNDTAPSAGDGDTLWVPYFAPDEPDNGGWGAWYNNNYLGDNVSWWENDYQTRQANWTKYNGASVSSSKGPSYNCQTAPITPLTNDKQDLLDAIGDMVATGNTNIAQGLVWGWRVISPTEPFTEGVAYDDEQYRKVIILLTDGQNVVGAAGNHNKSTYSAYGYVKDGRLGSTNSSTAQANLDTRTSTVCANIKSAHADRPITVYTITFQLDDDDIKDLMENCATDPEKFFDSPSNTQLEANFEAIAGELSELRISK